MRHEQASSASSDRPRSPVAAAAARAPAAQAASGDPSVLHGVSPPLVSVVMPAYNSAAHIRDAIDSVLAQTYRPIEIIVIDDGSTDATGEILARYGAAIRVLAQKNGGAAAARNAGMRAALGAFIAFLDADDFWMPEKVERQVAYLTQHPEVGLVYNNWWLTSDGADTSAAPRAAEPLAIVPELSGWIYHLLLRDCFVHTSSAMIRRDLAEKVGAFDVALRRGQDYDYWLRVSRLCEIHKLEDTLSAYRLHSSSITTKAFPVNFQHVVLSRALRTWGRTGPDGRTTSWVEMRKILAGSWAGFAYGHYKSGSAAVAAAALMKSIAAWPFRLMPWTLLLKCSIRPLLPAPR